MPPMVVQMIAVGEQTGALDAMLTKIADFYEEEVDVAVASMTSLIEPMMMVFLGTRDRRPGRRDVHADLRDGRQHQGELTATSLERRLTVVRHDSARAGCSDSAARAAVPTPLPSPDSGAFAAAAAARPRTGGRGSAGRTTGRSST